MNSNKIPAITVIIPVYNVDKYLYQCIESVINQTFTDFELLLIDDGSTDNSPDICDYFQSKDMRIKAIHKKNEGVSSARNIGLEQARGEYVCFIDSDDWIDEAYLYDLITSSSSQKCDLSILSSVSYEYYNKKNILRTSSYSKNKYSYSEIVDFLIENNFFTLSDGGCFSKLFKRKLINIDSQRFLLDNSVYEDTLFVLQYICKCNSIKIKRGSFYHYVHRNMQSLSTTIHPYEKYLESGKLGLKVLDELESKYDISKDSTFHTKGITKFLNVINYSLFSMFSISYVYTYRERIILLKELLSFARKHKKYYKINDPRYVFIKLVLGNFNLKIADKLFLLAFKISSKF